MILTGKRIIREIARQRIVIDPLRMSAVNPNSVDLHLGPELLRYTDLTLDPARAPKTETISIPTNGFLLRAGQFVLGSSVEIVGSNYYVPILHGKSSTARAGLFVHVTADLIDIGSLGCVTFQLLASAPIWIHSGMPVGQISFWRCLGEIELYRGKYQGSRGPRASESYRDEFWQSLDRSGIDPER